MRRILWTTIFLLIAAASLEAQDKSPVAIDYDQPQTYTLSGFEVEGIESVTPNSVILHTGLAIGDEVTIPGQEIPDAIKRLWDQKVFDDIQIFADKVIGDKLFLRIVVQERPRVLTYSFRGITKSQGEDIREKPATSRGPCGRRKKKSARPASSGTISWRRASTIRKSTTSSRTILRP